MALLESNAVLVTVILAALGTMGAFVSSYLRFMGEFQYIKGQISQLLEIHEGFTALTEKHGKMDRDNQKTIDELERVILRIELIEAKLTRGIL